MAKQIQLSLKRRDNEIKDMKEINDLLLEKNQELKYQMEQNQKYTNELKQNRNNEISS